MTTIRVRARGGAYDAAVGEGLLERAGEGAKAAVGGSLALVLTDENVAKRYLQTVLCSLTGAGYEARALVLPAGEATKSLSSLETVYGALAEFGATREGALVCLGGGVIGDLGGFAAATYLRGMRLIQLPTTLLAQLDSAVGGKTGVNLPFAKNMVGCFYQPSLVLADTLALDTLPARELRCGMGEMVKYACLFDETFFETLASGAWSREDAVARCLRWKARAVEADETDRSGERALLNFGHTLGHALERARGYGALSHGEAVAVGMAAITRWAASRALTPKGVPERLEACLASLGLPARAEGADAEAILRALRFDKKRSGRGTRVVLLRRVGEAYLWDADDAALSEAARWL